MGSDRPRADPVTLSVYDRSAATFAASYEAAPPTALHDFVARRFHPRAPTADVGCGSGRDAAWLASLGHAVTGYDASSGMLAEARRLHPSVAFGAAALPDLAAVPDAVYANVLCCGVLMHLPRASLAAAARALVRIARPDARLVVTVRASRESSAREADGRLYTPLSASDLDGLFAAVGADLLASDHHPDATRPDVRWLACAFATRADA